MRVLLVTLNFSPELTGIAPYSTRLALGLAERGHKVHVLTAYPHYPEWRIPRSYSGWSCQEELGDVSVSRVRHYVPATPSVVRRILSELSFGIRLLFARWGEVDVVVLVSPALIATAVAMLRVGSGKNRPGIGVVVQDIYSAGVGEVLKVPTLLTRILFALETRVFRRSDGIVVIHDRFRGRLVGAMSIPPRKIDVIRNWTHVREVGSSDRARVRREFGWGTETVVVHAGAMGDKQGLENVVEAARVAERTGVPLRFVLFGNGGQRRKLEESAAGCLAIEFRDPVPEDQLLKVLRAADWLLVNEKPGVMEMAVPSKLTTYFMAGIPVLAATSFGSTTSDELVRSGAGLRVDPGGPAALVAAASSLQRGSQAWQRLAANGVTYCERVLSEASALNAYSDWVAKLHHLRTGEI